MAGGGAVSSSLTMFFFLSRIEFQDQALPRIWTEIPVPESTKCLKASKVCSGISGLAVLTIIGGLLPRRHDPHDLPSRIHRDAFFVVSVFRGAGSAIVSHHSRRRVVHEQ